ncbi:uncharacterized protein MELLADRAFT_115926 [Melampsora larici-populina 98AG31]|uniref:RING-type domain-containing protein n=1 Tax=Melampsora larici-populina (strain 98AG31 / pathotype 3-4-7) TaxID=747676 RepID=F4RFQ9_MELLP|nr:uncharacterized protein MELLADRAFT_115926 [Melampsora larici-populina 98AG31]EGG08888.1 hypothetical protein MELLADRAFT_115926 [Melampsora larici-populina 98AG31]
MADRLSHPSTDLDCHSINQSPLKPITSDSANKDKDVNESRSDSHRQSQDQLSATRLSLVTVASSSLQAPASLSSSIPSSSPSPTSDPTVLNPTSLSLRTQPSSNSSLSSVNPSHHLKRASKKNRSSGSISLGISNLLGPFRSPSNITASTTDRSTSNTELNNQSRTDQNESITIAQSSPSATPSPAASSQSRTLASVSSVVHLTSSHPPLKPKRDFLGLDLHLPPRLSSSQASKSGSSFLASLSSINNKSHKSSSSSSNSPRPSTASSTLSGTPRLRNSHHRLSFQPPTKLSPPQPLHPIGRSFVNPISSPQDLVKSIPSTVQETYIPPSGLSSSVKTFGHPFASPTKPPRLPTSISAPHISSLLPHSSSLAKSQPTTEPPVHCQLTSPTKPLTKSDLKSNNLNFSFQPTEPILSIPKVDRNPPNPVSHSLNSKMRAMFGRKPSVTSTTSSSTASSNHPTISPPVPHPKFENKKSEPTAVFVRDQDDGDDCPVCLEDLKMRLQGEKPHVIPSCGHILHASCFEAVYGNIVEARKSGQILGLCGVCRKDMRLGDLVTGGPASRNVPSMAGRMVRCHSPNGTISAGPDATLGKNTRSKFAAMAGLQASPAKAKANSVNRKPTAAVPAVPYHDSAADKEEALEPDEDDELLNIADSPLSRSHGSNPSSQHRKSTQIIQPNIYAISELSSLSQPQDARQTQHLTCMVSIEIPSRNPAPFPPTPTSAAYSSQASPLYHPSQAGTSGPLSSAGSAFSYPGLASVASPCDSEHSAHNRMANPRHKVFPKVKSSPNLGTASLAEKPIAETAVAGNPLQLLVDDLINRIQDWKGHSLTDFGSLKLHDRIQVRKQSHSRDFLVYLFEEALLCVHEEKQARPASTSGPILSSRLRLKGRIYIRHMTAVIDSSSTVPLTLTIQMQDDNMDVFVMRFNDAAQLESWKANIQLLIDKHFPDRARLEGRMPLPPVPSPTADTITSPILATSEETYEVLPETATSSEGGYASSSYTAYTKTTNLTSAPTLYSVGEEDDGNGSQSYPAPRRQRRSIAHSVSYRHTTQDNEPRHLPRTQSPSYPTYHTLMTDNPFNNIEELPPIDLMLMISITTASTNYMPTSSNMKSRLIKETLEFVIRHLHPRSRLSLIIYSVGSDQKSVGNEKGEPRPQESQLKKTPFLCVGKESSRRRLEFVIEQIARGGQSSGILNPQNERYYSEFEPFYRRSQQSQHGHYGEPLEPPPIDYEMLEGSLKMIEMAEEKVSVATAMNLAYDIILQRKQKNPLSGFLLLHDQRDTTTKPQMALVMTRAEAANVPVHTIGWGKVHNPSCLWQLSNHTGGTYTYVNDLYEIKDTLTGCIGGMISIGATNAKLQISVPEHRWFKMKKVTGVMTFVLSANGQHADIDLGEMRYGERREILIEVEMRDGAVGIESSSPGGANNRGLTGTDAFFMDSVGGLKEIGGDGGVGAQDFYQAEFDQLSDDVPLLEVDASYRDPIAGKTVSRLVRPVLLSITIVPPQPLANPRVSTGNEPGIVRRRIELLTSDSLTRALVLVSRRMERQASRLLEETRHIVHTVLGNIHNGSERPRVGSLKGKKAVEQSTMREVLTGCLEDIEMVLVVIEDLVRIVEEDDENETNLARHQFDSNERNIAAQQSIVLKNQSAWTGRTLTEKSFWKADRSMMFYLKCMHST